MEEGVWEEDREPFYEPYNQKLSEADLQGAIIDDQGLISRDGIGIGIMVDGIALRGFKTPSRKFEIRSAFVNRIGRNQDCSELIAASGMTKTKNRHESHLTHDLKIEEMPVWFQPRELQDLPDDELVMTSFKWNVHNHGRTMNLKWLAEIVHSNPAWLNPETAGRFGLENGDWIEITSFYSRELERLSPHLNRTDLPEESGRRVVSHMRVPVVLMEGIHPRVIAMSNSCGHTQYTSVAQARRQPLDDSQLAGCDAETYVDADWQRNMWWQDDSGGDHSKWQRNRGNGWNQNRLIPIAPDPITGQQAFHDTVVRIRKID